MPTKQVVIHRFLNYIRERYPEDAEDIQSSFCLIFALSLLRTKIMGAKV